jgi:hypothetical protein
MPELISPDGLEADAVVPQCLDNQYVSDHVFQDMISRGVDYTDAKVAGARERAFRTEFIRSLVYSSQMVIQRAFLKNSDFLYKNYQLKEGDDSNLRAFAALIRKPEPAIIPFLFNESSLTDNLQFDVRKEGDAALRALLEEVGDDVRCVRLAINDTANSDAADSMATIFGEGLTRLRHLGRSQRNAMASELFADPSALQEDGAWDAFQNAVNNLAVYAFNKAGDLLQEDEKITRTNVYVDCFIAGSSDEERKNNVALGRFKAPGKDDFLLEMKKYVDLVYNTNLPDRLRRYTFTPVNMPSRMALQDAPSHGFGHQQISDLVSDDETLEWVRRSFMDRMQSAMDLPLLSDLGVADVLAIRGLPEWEPFKNAQQQILQNPLRVLESLQAFQESFDRFQHALSDWYNDKYKRDQTIQRYCNVVTWVLSIGGVGVTAVAGSHLGTVPHDLLDLTIPEVAKRIPRRVKGYAAKLMVGVYDIGSRQLDADRSYSIELMRTNEELMREDVVELLRSVDRSENALPGAAGLIADQGIQ